MSIKRTISEEVEILLTKEYEKALDAFAETLRDTAKAHIKEDCGGLTGSINTHSGAGRYNWKGGSVTIDVPYASFVDEGRGEIDAIYARSLSNAFTSHPKGHTGFGTPWFGTTHAGAFEGYGFVGEAIRKFEASYHSE